MWHSRLSANNSLDFCFCTLALRSPYRQLARQLAFDLERYAPGVKLIVGTDRPQAFADCTNVVAFWLKSQGILHCFHDKRFVLERAHTYCNTAIMVDADTRLQQQLCLQPVTVPGIAAVHCENLIEHVQRYTPERLPHLQRLADKLDVDLASVQFVGEALFALMGHPQQTTIFLQQWDVIARYLELHGVHAGEGNAIGLAAAKAGLTLTQPTWLMRINRDRQHLDASQRTTTSNAAAQWLRRLRYHKRLNQSRLRAMQDFAFYYR